MGSSEYCKDLHVSQRMMMRQECDRWSPTQWLHQSHTTPPGVKERRTIVIFSNTHITYTLQYPFTPTTQSVQGEQFMFGVLLLLHISLYRFLKKSLTANYMSG